MNDDPKACIDCMAAEIALTVLVDFTEMHDNVKMSYTQWLDLSLLIEDGVKKALGVPVTEENEPVMIQ